MLTILTILTIAAVALGIWLIKTDDWNTGDRFTSGLFILFGWGLALILLLAPLVDFSFGEKTYTGYIYSAEDSFDKTVGHIRYSENAGADSQPSFCTVKGSDQAKLLKELAGSGKKVIVTVPSGFALYNWYGQCGLPANIEVKTDGLLLL